MRCLLALFDQSHLAADRTYWTWRHPDVPSRILDAFVYDCVAEHVPDEACANSDPCIRGGFCSIDDGWVCWYRFVEAGRDKVGRPGRIVLIAAFIRDQDHSGRDWSGILESAAFQQVAEQAATNCPVPAPGDMEVSFFPPPVKVDSAGREMLVNQGRAEFMSPSAIQDALSICLDLPLGHGFDCSFVIQRDAARAVLLLRRLVEHQPSVAVAEFTLAAPFTGPSDDRASCGRSSQATQPTKPRYSSLAVRRWKTRLAVLAPVPLTTGFVVGLLCGLSIAWWFFGSDRGQNDLPAQHKSCAQSAVQDGADRNTPSSMEESNPSRASSTP